MCPASRGFQEPRDLLGEVLAVGVDGDDRVAAAPEQRPERGDEGRSLAAVRRVRDHVRPRPAGGVPRPIGGSVVHDQYFLDDRACATHDVRDGGGGLEGGDGGGDPHHARAATIHAPAPPPASPVTSTYRGEGSGPPA